MEGMKDAVVSSLMSGPLLVSVCSVFSLPVFLLSPTKCRSNRLYGALKFLMKVSLRHRHQEHRSVFQEMFHIKPLNKKINLGDF